MVQRLLIPAILMFASDLAAAELAQRWAILASPKIQQTGVSDLLLAELSQSLELVEREQLQKVFDEVELSVLAGAEGSPLRLQLGPKIQAEGLVLLTLEQSEPQQPERLKLVICETRFGVRLHVEFHPWPVEEPESLSGKFAKTVVETRDRFPDGVKQIIGVGPFLSKNLLHDYDYLQRGFAGLLGQSLLKYPGVAVLEFEECRTIGRELELNTAKLKERIVPVLVEADYQLTEQGRYVAPSDVTLSLSVKSSGANSQSWSRQDLPLGETSEWIRTELPARLIDSATMQSRAVDTDQQFAALSQRADMFAIIGDWDDAIAMRESALLLKDNFVEQLRLIGNYRRGIRILQNGNLRERIRWQRAEQPSSEEQQEMYQRLDDLEYSMHLRFVQLIEHQLIARDVSMIEGALLWSSALTTYHTAHGQAGQRRQHEHFRKTYWDNIPRLKQLDPTIRNGDLHPELRYALEIHRDFWSKSPGGQSKVWTSTAVDRVLTLETKHRFLNLPVDKHQLFNDLERMLTECAPWPVPKFVVRALPKGYVRPGGGELERVLRIYGFDSDDLKQFYSRLASSREFLPKFYGRIGLLGQRLTFSLDEPKESPEKKVLDEIASLRRELSQHVSQNHPAPDAGDIIDGYLSDAEVIATRGFHAYIRTVVRANSKPSPQKRDTQQYDQWLKKDPATIRFEAIDGINSFWDYLVPCGPSLDAVFQNNELWLMTRPGERRSIFQTDGKEDPIQHVHWDGRWLWVTNDVSGLRVFDTSGKLLGHLPTSKEVTDGEKLTNGQSLPPVRPTTYGPSHFRYLHPSVSHLPITDHPSFRACPVGGGRCVVAAQFGELKRSWVCLVELDESGKWTVNLVHQGLQIPTGSDSAMIRDARYAFRPAWMVPFDFPGGESNRVALIGRFWNGVSNNGVPPLVLDLATKNVRLLPAHFQASHYGWQQVLVIDGQLVHKPSPVVETLQLLDDGRWRSTVMDPSPSRSSPSLQGRMLPASDNTLLVPDPNNWIRLHTKPWKIERLRHAEERPDPGYRFYASSSHFGPVVWRADGPLMRVVVEEKQPQP